MMQVLRTSDVASHHTNPNYRCLLVTFVKDGLSSPNFQYTVKRDGSGLWSCDWLPRDQELLGLVKELAAMSPTFKYELVKFCVDVLI